MGKLKMNRHPPGGRAAGRPSVCPAWADALRRGIHLSASVRSRTKLCFPPWGPEAPVLPLFYPVCPDTGRWFKLSSRRGMPLDLRMVCGGLAAPAPASASRCFRHGAALRCGGRGRAEPVRRAGPRSEGMWRPLSCSQDVWVAQH